MITRAKSSIKKSKKFLSHDTDIVVLELTSFKQVSKDPRSWFHFILDKILWVVNRFFELNLIPLVVAPVQGTVGCHWQLPTS